MRGELSGIALIVPPRAHEGTRARIGTEVRHITGWVVSLSGSSIGPLTAEIPDNTGRAAVDDEDDEDDDDDDDDDDDELEM